MNQENVSTEAIYKNLLIIWLGLFMSQFALLLMVYFVEPKVFEFDFTKPILDQNSLIIIIFAVAAAFNLALSFVLKKRFLEQAISEQNVGFVQTAMITGCALCESVSIFGIMLAFIAAYQYFFAWMILGTFGMLFHFPRRKNVMNADFGKNLNREGHKG